MTGAVESGVWASFNYPGAVADRATRLPVHIPKGRSQ